MIRDAPGAVRLDVDRDVCMGHARCVDAAPDLFDLDDDGMSVPRRGLVDDADIAMAHAAALACPERAVQITSEVRP